MRPFRRRTYSFSCLSCGASFTHTVLQGMGRTELVLLIGGKARYVEPFEDAVFGSVARTLAARVPEQESDARRR
jgi:hypothetical protein